MFRIIKDNFFFSVFSYFKKKYKEIEKNINDKFSFPNQIEADLKYGEKNIIVGNRILISFVSNLYLTFRHR